MKDRVRKIAFLIGEGYTRRWLLLVPLAVLVGVFETVGAFLVFTLLSLITAPSSALSLPAVGELRTRFAGMSDDEFLLATAFVVGVFFVLRGVAFLTQSYLQNRLSHNAGVRLAARLLSGYLRMPYAFHLRTNTAVLIRDTNTSVVQIVTFVFVPLVMLVSECLLITGLLTALVVASPIATLLVLVAISPLAFVLTQFIRRGMRKLGHVSQEMSRLSLQALQESLQSVRDIKVLQRRAYFEDRFSSSRSKLGRALYIRGLLIDVPRATTETMLVVFVCVFLAIAVIRGVEVQQSLAMLGLFGYAGVRLLPSVNRIVTSVNNLQFGGAAVNEVYERLTGFPPFDTDGAACVEPLSFTEELRVTSLTFHHETAPVLDQVSFSVRRGESLGIVGSTGAGKSTLVDIIMGLLDPDSGSVRADGVSVHEHKAAWQRNLGIVPQTIILIDDSLRRNIAFGIPEEDIDPVALESAIRDAKLDDVIDSLPDGIDTFVGERGIRLSGGQRQRVAIARALYRDPEILIFDEATSALDNVTETELIDRLQEVRRGRTVLMVAHRLTTVSRCDRIIVLEAGKLIDSGTFEELVARNVLFEGLRR